MPTLTGPLAQHQALVNVEIAVPAQRARHRLRAGLRGNLAVPARGLLDTGAYMTCIDRGIRQALSLTPFGTQQFLTPHSGPNPPPCYIYKVKLTILHPSGSQFNLVRHLLTVVEAEITHLGVDVLIGGDVLEACRLLYDGPAGTFSLDY
jgi:hypothetical protein